jgi:hypothetical protein
MANPSFACLADVQVKDGNRIEVKAKNIAQYKVALNDKLVDTSKSVTIVTNGKESYSGPFKPEIVVDAVKLPESEFKKSHKTPGGMTNLMTHATYCNKKQRIKPFMRSNYGGGIWIAPTGGTQGERAALKNPMGQWVTPDTKVSDKQLKSKVLIIYGGPGLNKVADKMADKLPIKFEKGKFTIGNKVYDKPEHCVKFIHPNPLNPDKLMVMFAFNDAEAAVKKGAAGKAFFGLSSWGFRTGDCQVYGIKEPSTKYGLNKGSRYKADIYIFDSNWQPPDQTVIGKAEADFGWAEILQLEADAIREAAGADVGVADTQPGFNQWKCWIRKGPITINDVAVTNSLPEFIMTCEMKGAQLKGFLASVKYSTAVKSKDDPAYDPDSSLVISEIDDAKTYRIAADYSFCDGGALGYGVNPSKMPKPHFFFTSTKEFLAHEGTSLKCSNLRQTEIEVAEAIVNYIKKRGSIKPKGKSGNLTFFVTNPELNEFSTHDWAFLSMPYAVKDLLKGNTVKRKVSLGFGFRLADSESKGSKKFTEFDLTGKNGSATIDMSSMAKKLPVTISVSSEPFSITGDCNDPAGGNGVKLEPANNDGNGMGVLVKIRIQNKGDKDIEGIQTMSNLTMGRINGGIWPGRPKKGAKAAPSYYKGYPYYMGNRKAPSQLYYALLLAGDLKNPKQPALESLVIPSGYNHGLIGTHRKITVKAKSTTDFPFLVVSFSKKGMSNKKGKINPEACMTAIKDALAEKLSGKK